jgi:hypothetical protein
MTGGVPKRGRPGSGRILDGLSAARLTAYCHRRGWAKATREAGVPETTMRNALAGKHVHPDTAAKLQAFADTLSAPTDQPKAAE